MSVATPGTGIKGLHTVSQTQKAAQTSDNTVQPKRGWQHACRIAFPPPKTLLAVSTGFFMLGCVQPGQFPGNKTRLTSVAMQDSDLVLESPSGYCIDAKMLQPQARDGFVLLPRCDLIAGPGFFENSRAGLITATTGTYGPDLPRPEVADLVAMVPDADVIERQDNRPIPLVKLRLPDHGASGASPDHWRSAFTTQGYVVVLALYAPDNSPLLHEAGAALLEETAQRSISASLRRKEAAAADQSDNAAASAPTRPRARPAD